MYTLMNTSVCFESGDVMEEEEVKAGKRKKKVDTENSKTEEERGSYIKGS